MDSFTRLVQETHKARRTGAEVSLKVAVEPEVITPEYRAPKPSMSERLRNNKLPIMLGLAAAALGATAALYPQSQEDTVVAQQRASEQDSNQDAPEVTGTQQLPTPVASPSTVFTKELKSIDIAYSGINNADGCVSGIYTVPAQEIRTEPLGGYTRSLAINSAKIVLKTCIDDTARIVKTDTEPNKDGVYRNAFVGLDATTLFYTATINDADISFTTIPPGKILEEQGNGAACKDFPVWGCPKKTNQPENAALDETAKKAVVLSLEAMIVQEIQAKCAPLEYTAAAQIPYKSIVAQAESQGANESMITFAMVDKNNKPFAKVPNYTSSVLQELQQAGATLKKSEQQTIFGTTRPAVKCSTVERVV